MALWSCPGELLSSASAADKLKVYYSLGADPEATPPAGIAPWTFLQKAGTITIPAGESLWLGFDNTLNEQKTKTVTLTLSGTGIGNPGQGGDVLERQSAEGYENASLPPFDGTVTPLSGSNADTIRLKIDFDPQPAWEVIEYKNTGAAALEITVKGTSVCKKTNPGIPVPQIEFTMSYGAAGAMYDDPFVTEIFIFPESRPVDTDMPPTFDAPVGSGTWSSAFVTVDPIGTPRPLGGIKFSTAGVGLATAEDHTFSFSMLGRRDVSYTMFAYDPVEDAYEDYLIQSFEGVPAVSTWGMVLLVLMVLAGGTIVLQDQTRSQARRP